MLWRGCPDAAYGVSEAGSEGGSGISGSPFLPPSPSQKSCVSPRVRAGLDRKLPRGDKLGGRRCQARAITKSQRVRIVGPEGEMRIQNAAGEEPPTR